MERDRLAPAIGRLPEALKRPDSGRDLTASQLWVGSSNESSILYHHKPHVMSRTLGKDSTEGLINVY